MTWVGRHARQAAGRDLPLQTPNEYSYTRFIKIKLQFVNDVSSIN